MTDPSVRPITALENRLLWILREMVGQHLDRDNVSHPDAVDSGFIRANYEALEVLCEFRHMRELSVDRSGGRWFQAEFVEPGKVPYAFGQHIIGETRTPGEVLADNVEEETARYRGTGKGEGGR